MIIDFHAHIYPAKIADKASQSIGKFYDAPMRFNGTSESLIASGSKIDVTKYVVHSAATSAHQVEIINNFIIQECSNHNQFIGYGTMHVDYENFSSELERIKTAGLKGIKLHTDFQKFQLDTPAMDSIYEKLIELDMPVLVHAGDCRFDFSGPKRIRNLIDKFPKLTLIAAHFGGYTEWDDAENYLAGQNVWMDTSSTIWKLPLEQCNRILKKHGAEKFLWGSDFPMWNHKDELAKFNQLDLTDSEKEMILYKNAERLLGIKL